MGGRGTLPEFRPHGPGSGRGRPSSEVAKAATLSDQSISTCHGKTASTAPAFPDLPSAEEIELVAAKRRIIELDTSCANPPGDEADRGPCPTRRFQAVVVMAAAQVQSRWPAGSWPCRPRATVPGGPAVVAGDPPLLA
jgi:hypothetical protein